MKKLWLKPTEWRDVYIEIVSAGVLFLIGLLSQIQWSSFLGLAAHLREPYKAPLWVFILLGTSVLFWAISIFRRLRVPAHERRYRTETFDRVRWEWSYLQGRVTGLIAYCTESGCGTELHVTESQRPFDLPQSTVFNGTEIYCTSCNKGFGIANAFDLADHARRKIEKKIRDGTWKQTTTA